MQSTAKLKNSPHPPRKMRLLADLVRGLQVEEALNILKYHPKVAYASQLDKLIKSAVANWDVKNEDSQTGIDSLYIKSIFVDEGKMIKRIQPAPQGRAHRVRKRSNHVTVVIDANVTGDVEYVESTEENND